MVAEGLFDDEVTEDGLYIYLYYKGIPTFSLYAYRSFMFFCIKSYIGTHGELCWP